MTTDLARRATVVELVRVYQQAVDDIQAAFLVIDAAEKRLSTAFTFNGEYRHINIRDRQFHCMSFDDPTSTLEALKRDTWKAFVERLEIRAMLSVARAKELDTQLERGELPEITEASVFAFARGYAEQLDTMLREAVEEVFDFLRPRGSQYKTNTEFALGKKCILEYRVDSDWLTCFRVNHYREAELTALENMFSALDGKGQVHKNHRADIVNAINATRLDSDGRWSTDYFEGRCFRNRNLHLSFKRPDLVARLNRIAGGKRLGKAAA